MGSVFCSMVVVRPDVRSSLPLIHSSGSFLNVNSLFRGQDRQTLWVPHLESARCFCTSIFFPAMLAPVLRFYLDPSTVGSSVCAYAIGVVGCATL
jgi:hypothetical protein